MNDPPREFLEFDAPDTRWWLVWAPKSEFRRQVNAIWREILKLREIVMASDRELFAAVIAGLQALGPAVDQLVAERDDWKNRALTAEGAAATDEADDLAAAQPAKDLVDSLLAKVTPAAPDVADQPAVSPEDAKDVVDAAPDPERADDVF